MRSGSIKVANNGNGNGDFYPHSHRCDECWELAKGNRMVFTHWIHQKKECRDTRESMPCPYHLRLTRAIKLKLFGIHPN